MDIKINEVNNKNLISIRHTHIKNKFTFLTIIFAVVFIISFTVGRYPLTIKQLLDFLILRFFHVSKEVPDVVETVIMNLRLPRILAAVLVGSSLAASGAAYQGIFKNPLASPDVLGASAGSAFGASLAIYFSFSHYGIQLSAFIFGIISVLLAFIISQRIRTDSAVALVLTGMLVSTLFSSAISLIKYVADPFDKLPTITFWLMGSLSGMSMRSVKFACIPIFISLTVLCLLRWQISVLSLGDEEAKALGVNTQRLRLIVIICSTVLTATSVCISGVIGWIGLVIPNLARLLVGSNYMHLLPATIVMGGTFLLGVDCVSRGLFPVEVPLGILTAFIGAPFFLILLYKGWRE
ncbi:putative ABC transporter permease protein HI_1471 [Tepidanaerobacter acetatoxydans Re1]|uniref:Putative ABC transporter permease protein HI_1471 n=1 Tax=Tepidanaerobacter acetatoxydans (strain DSM 21804 / JCM 16047 / Re1) TaxID=1209989 RepID=F4LUQ6_TEPAE|nr:MULTISPECIES: iron ABC transporter permease [Tepidanaerobacter]AEE90624.1 ABC-type transporter, integral membrane subunit [Tepidanaerobacter acetatoxydans Re1]CCP25147.1 putative ABC transporter permease protein HI_1471 [Tepidanaerobacter acetatoxydans Re1]